MSDYFQIIKGKISDLKVIDTSLAVFGSGALNGLPAISQALMGDNLAAASQVATSNRYEDESDFLNSVQYFTCKIGNLEVQGIFCRAFFRMDKMEVRSKSLPNTIFKNKQVQNLSYRYLSGL